MHVWITMFIERAGQICPMLAALTLVGGVIILLLGWRLSRLVAVLDFSLFGTVVGAGLTVGSDMQWLSASVGAVAFGALALWLEHYGEIVSCGLVAGLVAAVLTGWLAPPLAAVLLVTAVAFTCTVALTYIAYRQASAVMTAVQGGLLTAFGLVACLACSGYLWGDVKGLLISSVLAQMMFLAAPIGVGVMFQLASIQNEDLVAC